MCVSAVSAAVCARLQLFDEEPFAALSGNYHFICQGHLIFFKKYRHTFYDSLNPQACQAVHLLYLSYEDLMTMRYIHNRCIYCLGMILDA